MTTMMLYRGEKNTSWPAPDVRLVSGMTIYGAWDWGWIPALDIGALWTQLTSEIGKHGLGSVNGYAQHLRAEGRPYALATARTHEGAFTHDYNYVLEVPNARTFLWAGDKNLTLGGEVPWVDSHASINAHYIVLNAGDIAHSTILGFGHDTGTREVTFFHDLPTDTVISCNDMAIRDWKVKTKRDLDIDTRVKYRNLFR